MAWVLSEYVMTMYAIGEPLAQCLLLGKQWRDRGRVGIASSWCHLVRESKVSTSREKGTGLGGSIATSRGEKKSFYHFSVRGFPKATRAIAKYDTG